MWLKSIQINFQINFFWRSSAPSPARNDSYVRSESLDWNSLKRFFPWRKLMRSLGVLALEKDVQTPWAGGTQWKSVKVSDPFAQNSWWVQVNLFNSFYLNQFSFWDHNFNCHFIFNGQRLRCSPQASQRLERSNGTLDPVRLWGVLWSSLGTSGVFSWKKNPNTRNGRKGVGLDRFKVIDLKLLIYIPFLIRNPYKPSFPLLLGGGTTQSIHDLYLFLLLGNHVAAKVGQVEEDPYEETMQNVEANGNWGGWRIERSGFDDVCLL